MKIIHSGAVIFCLLLCSIISIAQNNTGLENNSIIIKVSGDTIKSPKLVSKQLYSNEDQVTYIFNSKETVLKADDLISYFDGTIKYYSEEIKGIEGKKLITYTITGPLYFGQSLNKEGTATYYIALKDEKYFINLKTNADNINGFLKEYLSDFDQFKSTYRKRINYEFESLAEFASAYNAYKEPATYVAMDFEKPQVVKFGFYASYNLNKLKLDDALNKTASPSLSIGMLFSNEYNRVFSLDMLATYNISGFEFESKEKVMLSTIGFEPSIAIRFQINNSQVKLNTGPIIYYNLGSKVQMPQKEVNIKGFNLGYNIGASICLKSSYNFFINYLHYSLKTKNYFPQNLDSSAKKGSLTSYRFGVYYTF